MSTHLSWRWPQVLLQSQHFDTASRVESAVTAGSNSSSSSFDWREARATACTMRRHQWRADTNEPVFRERQESRVQGGNCARELAKHHSSTTAQLLCHHESTRKSRKILLVQALLQARWRHRWNFGFLKPNYPMCSALCDFAMRRDTREQITSWQQGKCQRRNRKNHQLHQAPWDLYRAFADPNDTSDSTSCNTIVQHRYRWCTMATSLSICNNDKRHFDAQRWTRQWCVAWTEKHWHRNDGLEFTDNNLRNEPNSDLSPFSRRSFDIEVNTLMTLIKFSFIPYR